MPATDYSGERTREGTVVLVWHDGGDAYPLPPRFDLRYHSPSGFEWGYGGSGPAQLALALAANALGDDEAALAIYQKLKVELVAKLRKRHWRLPAEFVRSMCDFLRQQEPEEEA